MHNVFHISTLWKYIDDPDHVIEYEPLKILSGLVYNEVLVRIMDRKEQELGTKKIPLVKVLWCNNGVEEASWELEQNVCNKYPNLFEEEEDTTHQTTDPHH